MVVGVGVQAPAVLLASFVPMLQSMESMGAQLLILRGRYDIRSAFLVYGMGLRMTGVALGAQADPAAVRQLADDAGLSRFRQVTQTPVNVVLELRP